MAEDRHLSLHQRIELAEQAVRDSDVRLRQRVAYVRQNFGKGVRGQITHRLKSWAGIGLGLAAAGATMWALWPKKRRVPGPQRVQAPGQRNMLSKVLIPMMPLALSALSRSGFVPPSVMNWVSLVSSLVAAKGVSNQP